MGQQLSGRWTYLSIYAARMWPCYSVRTGELVFNDIVRNTILIIKCSLLNHFLLRVNENLTLFYLFIIIIITIIIIIIIIIAIVATAAFINIVKFKLYIYIYIYIYIYNC